MTTTAAFWDKVAAKYAAQPVKDEASYTVTLDRTAQYLTPQSQVLEIGGGTGSTALRLAEHAGQIVMTDISANMVAEAQSKIDAAGVQNVSAQVGTVHDDDRMAGSYDAVIAFNLLHLVPDYPGDIRRAADLLKPGGVFISKSGTLADGKGFLKPIIAVMRWFGKAPEVVFFTTAQLEAAMRDAGFEIVESDAIPAGSINRFIVARKRG